MKIGFVPLTDCAPLVIAKELGFFVREGIDVKLGKVQNWMLLLDRLQRGEMVNLGTSAPPPRNSAALSPWATRFSGTFPRKSLRCGRVGTNTTRTNIGPSSRPSRQLPDGLEPANLERSHADPFGQVLREHPGPAGAIRFGAQDPSWLESSDPEWRGFCVSRESTFPHQIAFSPYWNGWFGGGIFPAPRWSAILDGSA